MTSHPRLIDAWDYLNEKAFGGEMVRPRFRVEYRLFLKHQGRKYLMYGAYFNGTIYISWLHDAESKLETLFHEMCHQYICEILDEHWAGHGKLFKEVYARGLEKLTQNT